MCLLCQCSHYIPRVCCVVSVTPKPPLYLVLTLVLCSDLVYFLVMPTFPEMCLHMILKCVCYLSTGWPCFKPGYPYPGQQLCTPHRNLSKPPHFSFTQIHIADVLKELQNLDPYKSARLDNLDHLFLKLSAAIVATPTTSLFNLSIWDP